MASVVIFIASLVFLGCIVFLAYYLYKVITIHLKKSSIQNQAELLKNSLESLDHVIESNVAYVNQKMVNPLKATGNFQQQEKEEAFHECRNRVYGTVPPEVLRNLSGAVADLEEFINPRIEYHVWKQKK